MKPIARPSMSWMKWEQEKQKQQLEKTGHKLWKTCQYWLVDPREVTCITFSQSGDFVGLKVPKTCPRSITSLLYIMCTMVSKKLTCILDYKESDLHSCMFPVPIKTWRLCTLSIVRLISMCNRKVFSTSILVFASFF